MTIHEHVSLKPFNTFGITVYSRYFTSFNSIEQIQDILSDPRIGAANKNLVLGGGSNILFTQNFDGVILKNEIEGITVLKEDDESIFIKVGAGTNWHQFVLYCLQHNYAGVENLSLIPGSVGASPIQNIGAYGVEIKDVFHQLEAFHVKECIVKTFSREECQFGYRDSVFKHQYKGQYIITSVTYRLRKHPDFNISYGAIKQELEQMGMKELSIQAISQAVINIRTSKLPDWRRIGNAGSFFKNPQITKHEFLQLKQGYPAMPSFPVDEEHIKVPAGWLIEQCGWKGYRKGDAGCYEKQALVLVNYGNATGSEIYQLSEEIIQSVKDKFNIHLEREVNIISDMIV